MIDDFNNYLYRDVNPSPKKIATLIFWALILTIPAIYCFIFSYFPILFDSNNARKESVAFLSVLSVILFIVAAPFWSSLIKHLNYEQYINN